MRNQYRTYMKREIKKTYPLLIAGILFLLLAGIVAASMTKGAYEAALLEMSDHFTSQTVLSMSDATDLFVKAAFGRSAPAFYMMAILVFLVLLLQQTFSQENRSGIADFLQVLPLRERDKVIMKLINAHAAIALYTLSFGVIMSLSCLSVNGSLQKVTEFYFKSFTQTNPYSLIWHSVLLQFLGMSSMYLIFVLTITCIHNRFLSYAIGVGFLISPVAFSLWFGDIFRYGQERSLIVRYFLPCYFFPDVLCIGTSGDDSYLNIEWDGYGAHITLYIGMIVVAGALIVFAVSKKWHIREAHNVLMNDETAAQFVITGIAFCTALFGADFILQMITYGRDHYSMVTYWVLCIIITIICYTILSIIRRLIEKRQQGM